MSQDRENPFELAREISDLTNPETDEAIYFPGFLNRLLRAIDAPAGIIWLKAEDGTLVSHTDQGLDAVGFLTGTHSKQNNELLDASILAGQMQSFARDEPHQISIPTEHLYVIVPLQLGLKNLGVVQILLRPNIDPRARPGYRQFIEVMSGFAARYIQMRRHRGQ
jgi:hypothetical protein